MQIKGTLYLLSLLFSVQLRAQGLPFEKYTSKNGLISDRITAVTQDEKGFMWFGSYFGICRYDGMKFEKIALPPQQTNKYVNCLLPANGKMYAGFLFGGGLAEYSNGTTKAHFVNGPNAAWANEFSCLLNSGDGNIIAGNSAGEIYSFKDGVFTYLYRLPLPTGAFPRSIQKDKNNCVWVGTDAGLFLLPPPYSSAKGFYLRENIFSVIKDLQGKIWIRKTNGSIVTTIMSDGYLNGVLQNLKIISATKTAGPVNFTGNTANGLWGIDYSVGLSNITQVQTKQYKIPLDFTTDISTIFCDRENNIWIANDPGILKISNFNIQTFLFEEQAPAGGSIFSKNDSELWVSNSKSLYTIDDNIERLPFDGNQNQYYGVLHSDRKNNLWIGQWNEGLWRSEWRLQKPVEKNFYEHFNKKKIKAQVIFEDSQSNMWIAGANGIFLIKNDQVIDSFHPLNAIGEPAFITCMSVDETNTTMWLGDNAQGIIKLHYEIKNNKVHYTVADYITAAHGLSDMYIRSILWHHNTLWAGTRNGGIYRIEQKGKKLVVANENANANINCTRVTDIKAEGNSAIWFATCNGIYRYQYNANKPTGHTGRWQHYNTGNGLLNAEVFTIFIDGRKGFVWALSAQGVTKLKINTNEKIIAPLITITNVSVLGKTDSTATLQLLPAKYSSVQNSIGFSFAGASFIDEKKILYKYMLQGFDKEWSGPVAANSINYVSLPAGDYVFKVLAANARGQWSEQPAQFQFQIVLPFYKTAWFLFVMITVALFIVYLVHLQRLKQRYKIEKLRFAIASDLHDDIGSTLGSINILSKTASRKLNVNESTKEIDRIFEKIGESAEGSLEAMDDIVWSINPQKDKFYDLIIRMREFAIPLLEAKDIELIFETAGQVNESVPMNLKRNVFLVFKESIYNILKHSGATQVQIKIALGNKVLLEIKDNGKGFITTATSNRYGLKNMRTRTLAINGELKINSATTGTQVLFSAPII